MTDFVDLFAARERLLQAAWRVIGGSFTTDPPGPHDDAEAEYAGEQLALAARELTRQVEKMPADRRPVGWDA